MAHQLAGQALSSGGGEPPHGPTFQEACRLLRANPSASGRYETLHQRLARNTLNEEDRLLVRIKKLMALARSHNRHEAEAAMLKAHELMHKHHVDQLAQKTRRDFVERLCRRPGPQTFQGGLRAGPAAPGILLCPGVVDPGICGGEGKDGAGPGDQRYGPERPGGRLRPRLRVPVYRPGMGGVSDSPGPFSGPLSEDRFRLGRGSRLSINTAVSKGRRERRRNPHGP